MAAVKVTELIQGIKESVKQKSASSKDEIAVMQGMLNDAEYLVDVYNASGVVGQYCPREDATKMIGSVIASATKVSKDEAAALADAHQFSKAEAASMVGISKEFINTYAQTGRKINLGGRATSNVSLIPKDIEAGVCRYPSKQADGTIITAEKQVPAYSTIKVKGSCPAWVK